MTMIENEASEVRLDEVVEKIHLQVVVLLQVVQVDIEIHLTRDPN